MINRGSYEYARDGSTWRPIDLLASYHATTWQEGNSGIYGLLNSFLRVSAPNDPIVTYETDGHVTIQSLVKEFESEIRLTISVDPETDQFQRYQCDWATPDPGFKTSIAASGEYGIDSIDYEALHLPILDANIPLITDVAPPSNNSNIAFQLVIQLGSWYQRTLALGDDAAGRLSDRRTSTQNRNC